MSNKPNNTFSYTYKIGNTIQTFNVTLPNGIYSIDDINDYLEYTMKINGTYLVHNGDDVFYINLKTYKLSNGKINLMITTTPQLRYLSTGWSNPSGLTLSTTIINPTITFSGNIIYNLGLKNSFTSGQGNSLINSGKYTFSYSFLGAYNYIFLPCFIKINSDSFNNIRTKLTDITIPNNSIIRSIPSNTFLNFTDLTNYTIGNSIQHISDNAFQGCSSLIRVLIPSTVTSVGDSVFKYCTNLTTISTDNILNKVIGTNMFNGCTDITNVIIPNYVTSIGRGAFQECNGLTHLYETNFLNKIIGAYMFNKCIGLTHVIIPNTVTSIGDNAFDSCTSLSQVEITNTTGPLASEAKAIAIFADERATFADERVTIATAAFAFVFTAKTYIVDAKNGSTNTTTYNTLANYTTSIGNNNLLVLITNAANLATQINDGPDAIDAAIAAANLATAALDNYATSVGANNIVAVRTTAALAHSDANMLHIAANIAHNNANIVAAFAATTINTIVGNYCFSNCPNLTNVKISSRIPVNKLAMAANERVTIATAAAAFVNTAKAYIANAANGSTNSATYNTLANYTTSVNNNNLIVLITNAVNLAVDVADGTSSGPNAIDNANDAVNAANDALNNYATSVGADNLPALISDATTATANAAIILDISSRIPYDKLNVTFESGAFQNCVKLTKIINILDNNAIYQISDYMFYKCTSLTNVIIPEFVTSIGNNAFQGCSKIYDFIIPNSVKNIESNVFDSCSGLTTITGANFLNDTISDYMFNNCVNLTSVVIPNNITSIGKYSFSGCTKLKNITIPGNLILDDTLFYNCNNITLTISSGIGVNSFSIIDNYLNNTRNITSLIISPSITSIGSNAFANCIDVIKIQTPSTIVSCGSNIFQGCLGLTHIDETNLSCNSIFDYMFNGCSSITSLIVPSYVTSIGTGAFISCTGLTNVIIHLNITSVGSNIFQGCIGLTSITESNILNTVIGANMFYGCTGLTNVIIPSQVTEIGSGAFLGCIGLTSITESNILNTVIGANMFYNCFNLTNVIIPSQVTEIGQGAFHKCIGLTSITGSNILNTVIGVHMFYSCTGLTNVIIPSQVTEIGKSAFEGCIGLTSITESNILNTVIGENMFTNCNLKNVIIPLQVTTIGDSAFTSNPYINNIEFKNAIIGANMFRGSNYSLKVLTIPPSITSIGTSAFVGFNEIKTINFQNNVIGDYMFGSCYHLYTIRIPISVTSIGTSAFQGCYSLLNINLYRNFTNSPNLTILGKDSFKKTDSNIYHYGSLRALISSGYTIESLLDAGFDYDAILMARGDFNYTIVDNVITNLFFVKNTDGCFVFPNNATSMNQSTIDKIKTSTLYITQIYFGFVFNLNLNNLLSNFPNLKKVYLNNITILGDYLFSGCTGLTSITLPDTLTSISNYAFQGCTGLKSITIPSSVINIGENVFQGCTSLTSIIIPSSVINISNYACQGCIGLKSITIPSTVTNVGNYAFQGCTSLINIVIPSSVTNVGDYAFQSCSNLTSFIIGRDFTYSSLTTLGYNCFANCNLLDIYCFFELFSDGYTKLSISNAGFSNINKVLNLTIVNGVLTDFPTQTIDPKAILCVPNNVSSISDTLNTTNYYSSVKNSLNTIFFTKNNIITDIPSNFLTDCSSLDSIVISPSITNIGINAFKNCINLEHLIFFDISKIKSIIFNTDCFLNVGNKSPISNSLAYDLSIIIKQLHYLVGKNTLTNAGFYLEIIDIAGGIDLIVENDIVINASRSNKYLNTSVKENIIVPLGITSIGTNAFSNVSNYVNNVYLSNELLSIGSRAFNSNSLIDITIPSSVSSVGDYAFSGCINLTNIIIQNSVIGNYMFQNCTGITSIIIPSTVTSVGDYAFQGCTNLKFIYISNITKPIFGTGVFQNCIKIINLDDYDSTVFGNFMFQNCTSLVSANVYTNNINDGLFMNCVNLTSVLIPSVTNIGNTAFKNCYKLVNIILPSASLTSIGDSAFEDCILLKDIIIPSSVIDIGHSAFKNCSKLIVTNKSIDITEIKPYTFYGILANSQFANDRYTDILSDTNYFEIDDSNNNFSYSLNYTYDYMSGTWKRKLKTYNVQIPNGLYKINDLNTILHASFDSIGFYRSTSIENPNFDIIGAFYNLYTGWSTREYYVNFKINNYNNFALVIDNISGIDSYILPNIFKESGYQPRETFNAVMNFPFEFSKLFGILSSPQMIFNATTNTFSTDLNLGNTNQLTYLFSRYILHLPKKITSIGEGAFGKTPYTCINFPDSLTSIGDGAFANAKLFHVIIPPNVTSIGSQAFFNNSLTNITIPSSIISIGDFAFNNNNLKNVNLERSFRDFNNVTILGNDCFGSSNNNKLFYDSGKFREYYFKGYAESDLANAGFDNDNINHIATGTISFVIVNNVLISASRKNYGTIAEAIIPGTVTSIGGSVFKNYNQNFNRQLYDVPANHLVSIDFGNYSKLSHIGSAAFMDCDYLTNIIIPTTVTSVGNGIFGYCSRLTNIIISPNVTTFGTGTFEGCSSLQSIPIILTNKIANNMFYGCSSLKSITIPLSVTSVGDYAFQECSGLTSVTILNKIISGAMFDGCVGIKSIIIPLSVTSVGDNAFQGCSGLTSITILNKNITAFMFRGCYGLTSIIIPSCVTSVGDYAFENCTGLLNLNTNSFLNSVIGNYMFTGCHGLTSVTIPSNITQMGTFSFARLNNLKSVYIDTDITGDSPFYSCSLLTKVDISNNCKYICNHAFSGCKKLNSINWGNPNYIIIPNSITFIGWGVFWDCGFGFNTSGITGAKLSNINNNSYTQYYGPLGDSMFYNNPYLRNMIIYTTKNQLENAESAFTYNEDIRNVDLRIIENFILPYAITKQQPIPIMSENCTIPNNMFMGCFNLSFTIPSNVTGVGFNAFASIKNIYNISSTITKIDDGAFANISSLGSVTLFPTLTSVGSGAFYGCTGLINVNIQNSVISDNMFENCTGLTNIVIPSFVTSIGVKPFKGCTGIKKLDETNLLNNVISTEMFRDCNNLTSITIPPSITQIGDTAFFDCKGLTNVNIQNSVIGSSMFRGCYALRNITIPPSVTSIGNYAFSPTGNVNGITWTINSFEPDERVEITQPNIGLTSVTIQNSVIGNNMFAYCHNLKNITIPSSITSVGYYAFFNCTRLTNINIQNSVIGSNMFQYCSGLTNITIPSTVNSIGSEAFYNCILLANINLKKNYLNQLTPLGQNCFGNTSINKDNIKQLYFEGYLRTYLIDSGININTINNSIGDINININNGILTDITSALGIPGVVLIPDSVTSISNNVFKTNKSIISEIYFNPTSNLVNITSNMFENCSLLTNIILPLNITNIGSNAFQDCSSLTNIILPLNITNIGSNAFQDCSSLTSVTIPCAAVVDSTAFTSCNNIGVTICKSDTSSTIKSNFLYSIPQITSITINNDITKIGSQCFYGCNKIKNINFKST